MVPYQIQHVKDLFELRVNLMMIHGKDHCIGENESHNSHFHNRVTHNVTHHSLKAPFPRHICTKCLVLHFFVKNFFERVFTSDKAKQWRGRRLFRDSKGNLFNLLLSSDGVNCLDKNLNFSGQRMKVFQCVGVCWVRHGSFVFMFLSRGLTVNLKKNRHSEMKKLQFANNAY